MLPDISLDDDNYDEILDEARNLIISRYPDWTDFNAHDPGITLLELFAMLKESQQFFADRIGKENKKKYLKLLGIKRRVKQPARSLIQIKAKESSCLLCAHKLDAGNLCFENIRQKQLVKGDVSFCMSVYAGNIQDFISHGQLEFDNKLHFWVFGKTPRPESTFYLCFDEPLPLKKEMDLYIEIHQEDGIKRNPLNGFRFVPLAQLEWQYYTRQGWKTIEDVKDETDAFLFSGFIRFMVDGLMEMCTVCSRTGYFIRAVIKEGEYDKAPVLEKISMNICEVLHKDTLAECIVQKNPQSSISLSTELAVSGESEVYIGKDDIFYPVADFEREICKEEGSIKFTIADERMADAEQVMIVNRDLSCLHKKIAGTGNGFPYQEIDLEDLQILYEDFEILIQDMEHKDGYRLWHKVEDFANSSAEDRHYVFDSQEGILCFGDCIHGMAPEGEIILAGYARTMGSDGNVKTGKINRFRMEELEVLAPANICDGIGGCDEESLKESFLRAKKSIKQCECAVTKQDYENYARQTPGLLLAGCKALSADAVRQFAKKTDETAVYLVVKPYVTKMGGYAKQSYIRNIKSYMEHYRMLGSRVFLFFPEYVGVEVYVEAAVKPQYLHVEERVRQSVQDFFDISKEEFGGVLSYSKLYGFLDRQDFIMGIRSLSMEYKGNGARQNADGDILLSPYGIAVLKEVRVFIL